MPNIFSKLGPCMLLWYEQLLGRQKWYGLVRLNCQLMTKLEMMLSLQAHVCGCISAHPGLPHQKTKQETSDASKCQPIQASWNRKVLNFGSEYPLIVHNYLLIPFCDFSLTARSGKSQRHYQCDWVCAAHLEYRFLVLTNVRITGIWIRKN